MIYKINSFVFIVLAVVLNQSGLLLTTASKFDVPERFVGNNESILIALDKLIAEYNPIDLGKGAPDFSPPENLRTALSKIALEDNATLSQYTNAFGQPRLRNALAKYHSKLLNRTLDPNDNVLVTVGATEALYITFQTHTNAGDEWIIIEPFFEPYIQIVKAAFGVPRFIALKPTKASGKTTADDWTFDREEMASLFNEKTKGILVNSPHNPIGKVFTLEELTFIADLAKKWNTLVIYDEVYQFLVFDQKEHIRMATLPGMSERTISIGSASKAFSATGLRLGWAYGEAKLLSNLKELHPSIVMTVSTPIQEAFAIIFEDELRNLGKPNSYLSSFRTAVELQRDYITKALTDTGMSPIVPHGGYFIVANWTALIDKVNLDEEKDAYKDLRFSKYMIKHAKVVGYPLSSFYSKNSKHLGEDGIRYCFVKKDKTLATAVDFLLEWEKQYVN